MVFTFTPTKPRISTSLSKYAEGRITTDFNERASTDQSLKGIKKLYKEDPAEATAKADEIIKNT